MSAIFNFQSFLCVLLLLICTCTYAHTYAARWMDNHKKGVRGLMWKCARIGEHSQSSPWVCLALFVMGGWTLFV